MALGAVGGMQATFERTLEYAQGARGVRPADRPLPGDPAQARRDGDEDRGRAATSPTTALRLFVTGQDCLKEVSMAKLFCLPTRPSRSPTRPCRSTAATATCASTTSSGRCATRASGPIGGGTDEIMKEIIGKQLGL